MVKQDNSRFLLFIEPKKEEKSKDPTIDTLESRMESVIQSGERGILLEEGGGEYLFDKGNTWRGFHTTDCGEKSSNQDILLENGMITNSLAVFYLTWYRDSIPNRDIEMLQSMLQLSDLEVSEYFPQPVKPDPKSLGATEADLGGIDESNQSETQTVPEVITFRRDETPRLHGEKPGTKNPIYLIQRVNVVFPIKTRLEHVLAGVDEDDIEKKEIISSSPFLIAAAIETSPGQWEVCAVDPAYIAYLGEMVDTFENIFIGTREFPDSIWLEIEP